MIILCKKKQNIYLHIVDPTTNKNDIGSRDGDKEKKKRKK